VRTKGRKRKREELKTNIKS